MPPESPTTPKDSGSASPPESWAIVGGGILGMTLALRLREAGKKVTLFEAAPSFGGLASAWQIEDLVWDRYYHVTLLSDARLRHLLRELGLEQAMEWVETRTGFYTDGELHSMSNTIEFLKFPPLRLIDKIRLGATIFYAARIKNWKKLEGQNVCDWLRKLSGKNTFEKIWLPLLRAKLGDNYDKVSAAFIWAIIARMYAARRSGLKKEMFGYVPGGYARILDRFVEVLGNKGVALHPGEPVKHIVPKDGQLEIEFNGAARASFDQVAVTLPARRALQVCRGLAEDERIKLREIEYQGIVCASVVLDKPVAGYYVTNITEDWVPFTAVIEMTALVDPEKNFDGKSLIYLPKYVPRDDDFFERSDEEIEEEFTAALLKMYPHLSRENILAFRISRARDVHALSTLHYSDRLPPMTTSIPGLHIVNSAHIVNGTLNVNETIQLAEKAAAQLSRLS